jgi:paraquat-inducible protein B
MDWHTILNESLKALVIAAIPWLMAKMTPLISAAFDYIEAKTGAEWARRLENEAEQIVLALWEGLSKGIKQDLADGKLTKEEAAGRLAEVGAEARKRLSAWLSGMPARFQPQVEQKVGAALEAALARLKIVKSIPPATVPTSGGPTTVAGSPVR